MLTCFSTMMSFIAAFLCVTPFLITFCCGQIYYVKPTPFSTCPQVSSDRCKTLQSYIDTLSRTGDDIIDKKNITVVFLYGTHTMQNISRNINIVRSAVSIKGEGHRENAPIIQCEDEGSLLSFFLRKATFTLHNVHLRKSSIAIVDDGWQLGRTLVKMSSMKVYYSALIIMWTQFYMNDSVLDTSVLELKQGMYSQFLNSHFLHLSRVYVFDSPVITSHYLFNVKWTIKFQHCSFSESQLVVMGSRVTLYDKNIFANTTGTAVKCYNSSLTVSGTALFMNNSGTKGGALAFYSGTLYIHSGANLSFSNNVAVENGGAIYIEPSLSPFVYTRMLPNCFYRLLDCNNKPSGVNNGYHVHFLNNSAYFGGDDLYGASFTASSHCLNPIEQSGCRVSVTGASSNTSSVSSDPTSVCLCDRTGQPQCNLTNISRKVSSGETFSLSIVPVGANFGTTSGQVIAYFINADFIQTFIPGNRVSINSKNCTKVDYSIYSKYSNVEGLMLLAAEYSYPQYTVYDAVNDPSLRSITINVTMVACPPGFVLTGDPPTCDCYHNLCDIATRCTIVDGNGLLASNGSMWMGKSAKNKTLCNRYCPTGYCTLNGEWIDILHSPHLQCANNRAGRLCGGCREYYSLAIGSNRCIRCYNNDNVSLVIFFALAGLLLVFFITALNLTVTQNMINELIFYANIMWIYQNIFFPKELETERNAVLVFLKTFIAWINLDFGIETCFVNGLTAFWKLWLQFVFPFYIWCIVWLIIIIARHSTRFTRLLPTKRTIPVLATVFLLSYIKLVNITSTAMKFSFISEYPNDTVVNPHPTTSAVWSLDGNLGYCGHPHIFLFLAGLATLLILWFPYTMLLLLMQWLRKMSHLCFLKWTQNFFPISDAYFAPLEHKHQYWFGVLLLTRGILLIISTSSFGIPYASNLLILIVLLVVLLSYMNIMQTYQSTTALFLCSSFYVNLIVLSGYFMLTYTRQEWQSSQVIAVGVSVAIVFLQFCANVIYAVAKECRFLYKTYFTGIVAPGVGDYWKIEDINDDDNKE